MISQYLKELIISQRRLIIPNLGAFLAKEDKDGQKNIIFSSFLKYNDGFLEKELSEKEKISLPQATEAIAKFVQQVAADLESKGKSIIGGFGYFSKDDRGGVQFTIDESIAADSEITPVVQLPDPVLVAVEGHEESKIEKVLDEAVEELNATSVVVEKESEVQVKEEDEKPVEPIIVPPIIIPPQTYSWQTEVENPIIPPVVPPVVTEETTVNNYYEEKKSRAWLWWLLILLLLLLGAAWYFFLGGKDCSIFACKKQVETVAPVDSTANKSSTIHYEFKYYVVTGCFVDLQNAQKLVTTLKQNGYDTAEIASFQLKGLYPVCVCKTNDSSEALLIKDRCASEGREVWIFDTTVPYGEPGIGGK